MKLPWIMISLVGWAYVIFYSTLPVEDWYELKSVTVTDTYLEQGEISSREIEVDRSIKKPFRGWYRVEEHLRLVDDSWISVAACINDSAVQYRPDSPLPLDVTIEWWAYGNCEVLPRVLILNPKEQEFRLCTWVSVEVVPHVSFFRKTTEPLCSNSYKGRALRRG